MSGLTIADLSRRSGRAVSAIRFYETHGIVHPIRNAGGPRRYGRADLGRLSFTMAAQRLGFPLAKIAGHLAALPAHRAPSRADWARVATAFRADTDARIAALQALGEKVDGCIGCGCLSLDTRNLYTPGRSRRGGRAWFALPDGGQPAGPGLTARTAPGQVASCPTRPNSPAAYRR